MDYETATLKLQKATLKLGSHAKLDHVNCGAAMVHMLAATTVYTYHACTVLTASTCKDRHSLHASKQEVPVRIALFDIPLSLHDLQSSLMLSLQDLLLASLLLLKGLECSLPLMLLALYARLMSPVQHWLWSMLHESMLRERQAVQATQTLFCLPDQKPVTASSCQRWSAS